MEKDPSYESPFNYAQPPYDQVNVALAIGQDWALLTEQPNVFNTPGSPAESKFNAGAVGMAIGQDWAGMGQNPFQVGNPDKMNAEQSFTQTDIGQSIGQDWVMMNGEGNLFQQSAEQEEAGFSPLLWIFPPAAIAVAAQQQTYCAKYCKALGYLRSADKMGFKKCLNDCKIHYKEVKSNRYKIKPAPEMDPNMSVSADESKLPDLTAAEAASAGAPVAAAPAAQSNTGMYVIIGVVVVLIIAAILFFALRKRAGK